MAICKTVSSKTGMMVGRMESTLFLKVLFEPGGGQGRMNRGNARRSLCYKTVEESLPSKWKGSSHFCHENEDFYVASSSETGPRAQISQQVWCVTPKGPPLAKAVQGLEPYDRNRFGELPDLATLSLPSSLSRRSAQLKATKRRPRPGRGNESRSCSGRGYEALSS